MFHPIVFCTAFTLDVEVSPQHRLERVRIRKGTRAYARFTPYVVETDHGPVEMADLHLKDGSVARRVRYAQFRFL